MLRINDLPKRTRKTNLDIDSLMLLDFLALNGFCEIKFLKKDSYPLHMNCTYSHEVSDDNLENKLEKLILSGFVNKKLDNCLDANSDAKNRDKAQKYIYLITEAGGRLWELERQPIWDKYCADSSYQDDCNKKIGYFELDAVTVNIGYQFSKCALNCGMYHYDKEDLKLVDSDHCLLYWKKFAKKYTWRALLLEPEISSVDWDYYEKHRTWWRDLNELQKHIA